MGVVRLGRLSCRASTWRRAAHLTRQRDRAYHSRRVRLQAVSHRPIHLLGAVCDHLHTARYADRRPALLAGGDAGRT